MILRLWLALLSAGTLAVAASPVRSYEGVVTIPTYEPSARELEPPLFEHSTVTGMYPFTTYLMPYRDGPEPKAYQAIFLENEYLKVTYIPEFGVRIYSVFDKLRQREMLYRNDVVKPAPYNPRNSWPQSGMELTGPHDLHTLTLHSEPYWANKIVKHPDGSLALSLGEIDPVYGMDVGFTATLHPGIAALEINVFCYNGREDRKPQMFWVNTAISATPETRFIYPMSRTVGHTTADIADWPIYNGIDYSFDRNNKHMLGVFGIDIYDNFQGAYQFDRDYGIFRYADRRVVQGMKLWTFGYGEGSKTFERGYTDNAGPYVELQSGRHVWDGHYEWVAPHTVEGWTEWWIPVSQTGGLTTLTRDLALKLDVQAALNLTLASTRVLSDVRILVTEKTRTLFESKVNLDPVKPFRTHIDAISGVSQIAVTVTDAAKHILLNYVQPDGDPGRKEYTPFTRPLEEARKDTEEMSAEELTLAAEYRLKELDEKGANALLARALKRDSGYSRAHLVLCMADFGSRRYDEAAAQCGEAIKRDPYADSAYYYKAVSQFALGQDAEAERTLYFIWPESAYYGKREYELGVLSLKHGDHEAAQRHLENAVKNGNDLLSRLTLAVLFRDGKRSADATRELQAVEEANPTNRIVDAERWLANPNAPNRDELLRMLGAQTQEALAVTEFYRKLGRWGDATKILRLVAEHTQDPWGTTPEFFYNLSYCERKAGDLKAAAASLERAKTAKGQVDRFPYRDSSEEPLLEAVRLNANDAVAYFDLACLHYFQNKTAAAIGEWEKAREINPRDFSTRRALGLAYAEQGFPLEKAAGELELAISLNPAHVRTLDDLSLLYARTAHFEQQLALLKKAQERSPADDDLAEGILTAYLNMGRYEDAQQLLDAHSFSTRHRSYSLRDKYRVLCYGLGARAYKQGDFQRALSLFQASLHPPVSLGVDTFDNQGSPRLDFYIGLAQDSLGKHEDARKSYERAIVGMSQLSGDRDSWNSENFYMVLALDRLGKPDEATRLQQHFVKFADTEKDSDNPTHRAEAKYLLGLVESRGGKAAKAKELLEGALEARPELLPARLELRGDAPNE